MFAQPLYCLGFFTENKRGFIQVNQSGKTGAPFNHCFFQNPQGKRVCTHARHRKSACQSQLGLPVKYYDPGGYPKTLITVIMNIYVGLEGSFLLKEVPSEPFKIHRGLTQDETLSRILWNVLPDTLIWAINNTEKRIAAAETKQIRLQSFSTNIFLVIGS